MAHSHFDLYKFLSLQNISKILRKNLGTAQSHIKINFSLRNQPQTKETEKNFVLLNKNKRKNNQSNLNTIELKIGKERYPFDLFRRQNFLIGIGHFQISLNLFLKASLGAHPFI